MKPTKKDIENIEELFKKINPTDKYDIGIEDISTESESVHIFFPRDDIFISASILIKYIGEYDINMSSERVESPRFTQMPVVCYEKPIEVLMSEINFCLEHKDGYTVRLVENPFLIGVAATKLDLYDKYALPCSAYVAIEIEYQRAEIRLSESEEMKVLKSFLFELSHLCNVYIGFTSISDSGLFEDYEEVEKKTVKIESITGYSEGMDLFRKALESSDDEIKFLYFYKIIEYYSVIASKLLAYDNLSKKVDSLRYKAANSKDLDAIFSIADNYKISQSDKELAKTILLQAIDIVSLLNYIPDEIEKRASKHIHHKVADLSYSSNKEILQKLTEYIGSVLYSTRNSIVHAKLNYRSDAKECSIDDLPLLNEFLKKACVSIIRWHDKLPPHIKYEA
ncbi:MAG: hypothetical protein R2800_12870 [Flavipsychrobacter sp.]